MCAQWPQVRCHESLMQDYGQNHLRRRSATDAREMEVRLAFGAQVDDVLRLILGEGLRLTIAGGAYRRDCVGPTFAISCSR
jgi:hypothetical protein